MWYILISFTISAIVRERSWKTWKQRVIITRVEIEKHLNCKKTKSYEIVKSLIDKKIIYKDGSGSNTKYLKIDWLLKAYCNQFEQLEKELEAAYNPVDIAPIQHTMLSKFNSSS